MNKSASLPELAQATFAGQDYDRLLAISSLWPLNLQSLADFDQQIGGPCMLALNDKPRMRYASADRDIFRPLQYCAWYFAQPDVAWLARDIVQMSALHIESLMKRIGGTSRHTLGKMLRNPEVTVLVADPLRSQIADFTSFYNDAKHNVSQPKDTHLFSPGDAVLAYFIGRNFGMQLYPLAGIQTDLAVFRITMTQ